MIERGSQRSRKTKSVGGLRAGLFGESIETTDIWSLETHLSGPAETTRVRFIEFHILEGLS